jgi:hypothetical protein
LFRARSTAAAASTQQRAERVAMTLVSFAPPEQAFVGAEAIARERANGR